MTVLNFAFAFVLLLGVLITVHEFGHFLVAKLCGVRVLKFSVGFGAPIGIGRYRLRWERGGTEYVLAWIPLGGFVKMLGENPGEEEEPEAPAAEIEEEEAVEPEAVEDDGAPDDDGKKPQQGANEGEEEKDER